MKKTRLQALTRRHKHIRRRIVGTQERPRLSVNRSSKHLYAQIIDDLAGRTLCAATSDTKEMKAEGKKSFSNKDSARKVGERLGQVAKEQGITRVVFDRGGYPYHGVIQELADAVRKQGIQF